MQLSYSMVTQIFLSKMLKLEKHVVYSQSSEYTTVKISDLSDQYLMGNFRSKYAYPYCGIADTPVGCEVPTGKSRTENSTYYIANKNENHEYKKQSIYNIP